MATDENSATAVQKRPLVSRPGLSIALWLLGLVGLIALGHVVGIRTMAIDATKNRGHGHVSRG